MSWTSIPLSVVAPGAPVSSTAFGTAVLNDLTYLYGNQISAQDSSGVPLVIDGSFEADAANTPGASMANWVYAAGTGGTCAVVNSQQSHGSQSVQFTQGTVGGNTAGTLTSLNYLRVSPQTPFFFNWNYITTPQQIVYNKIVFLWFTASGTPLAPSTTVFDSGPAGQGHIANAWSRNTVFVQPPTSAVLAKIQLIPGYNGSAPPIATANFYYDSLSISPAINFPNTGTLLFGGSFTIPAGVYQVMVLGSNSPIINVLPGQIMTVILATPAFTQYATINGSLYGPLTLPYASYVPSFIVRY